MENPNKIYQIKMTEIYEGDDVSGNITEILVTQKNLNGKISKLYYIKPLHLDLYNIKVFNEHNNEIHKFKIRILRKHIMLLINEIRILFKQGRILNILSGRPIWINASNVFSYDLSFEEVRNILFVEHTSLRYPQNSCEAIHHIDPTKIHDIIECSDYYLESQLDYSSDNIETRYAFIAFNEETSNWLKKQSGIYDQRKRITLAKMAEYLFC